MNNWEPWDLEVPLDFLGQREFEARTFSDGPDADTIATSVTISSRRVSRSDQLSAHLAPGGGLAVIFTPLER